MRQKLKMKERKKKNRNNEDKKKEKNGSRLFWRPRKNHLESQAL